MSKISPLNVYNISSDYYYVLKFYMHRKKHNWKSKEAAMDYYHCCISCNNIPKPVYINCESKTNSEKKKVCQ